MALREIVPWRRALGRSASDAAPFDSFRREIESLHRSVDRLFESVWGEGIDTSLLPEVWARGEIVPQLDVTEDDTAFQVTADLPGLDEKDIDVTLSDRILTIRGEKKQEKETKQKDVYRRERAYGTFRRSIEIPAPVDAAKIEASFKKGVLTIRLPKSKEAQEKIKHIDVKAA